MFPSSEKGTVSFDSIDSDDSHDENHTNSAKKKKKSGGFESFGLTHNVFGGVKKKGYRVPTPIQRKVIPLVLAGKDVVAMARTGSGKTAAFLVPILEKLHDHSSKVGARALILAPTRELALQTFRFAREIGKFTDLRICLLVGGDSMESQFENLAQNPDIIIATPGRLVHHIAEVQISLKTVQFLVFDEADRMFEMGFEPQIRDIAKHLGTDRQTLLFSATMPEQLAAFARAGLHNAEVVRLDAETKISPDLHMQFFCVRKEEKEAALLFLLRKLIGLDKSTIVFSATRHHTEFLHLLLSSASINSSVVYGSMDQVARTEAVAKFREGHVKVLLVTDVAARGIDIPLLDAVVNFDFPCKPKLFVHRVGRTARNGRSGVAYSLVSRDELPFMVDLHLFLGAKMTTEANSTPFNPSQVCYGSVPQILLSPEVESVRNIVLESVDLTYLVKTVNNAYKLYYKTRASASPESVRRSKELTPTVPHPIFTEMIPKTEIERLEMVTALQAFRPSTKKGSAAKTNPVSSTTPTPTPSNTNTNTNSTKSKDSSKDSKSKDSAKDAKSFAPPTLPTITHKHKKTATTPLKGGEGKSQNFALSFAPPKSYRDDEYFMDHTKSNLAQQKAEERGYSINDEARNKIEEIQLDLVPDDNEGMTKKRSIMRWDARKKNYVQMQLQGNESILEKTNRMRNESGAVIQGGKKTKSIYEEWKKKKRRHVQIGGEEGGDDDVQEPPTKVRATVASKRNNSTKVVGENGRQIKSELRTEIEIRKKRKRIADKRRSKQQRKSDKQAFMKKRVEERSRMRSAPQRAKIIKRR